MYRLFFFLLGFGLMVIGFTYIITYLNLISMGYSIIDYIKFITSRLECLFSMIGLLMISMIIVTKGDKSNDIHI